MWYETTDPDPAETVTSVVPGYHFHCPNVASVDQHLAELCTHIGPGSNLVPSRQDDARRDIDRLLDRRLYLMLMDSGPGQAIAPAA
jgi:hypothetical protein